MTTPLPEPGHPPYGAPSFAKPPLPQTAPPGWYPGPAGALQWWDGQGWGPTVPPGSDNSSTLAVFAHLGTFVGGFVVPLVILLTEGKRNRFVKHHATEALNWAITVAIASVALMVVYVIGLVASIGATSTGSGAGFGAFFGVVVVVFGLLVVLSIGSTVLVVIGAVKAGGRQWWRYPVAIRFVKGAASKEEVDALNRSGVR